MFHQIYDAQITWGAGASTKSLTMAISEYAQKYFGVEVLMHLTCSGQTREQIRQTLVEAKEAGIHNVLALRGDPPKGALTWTPARNGFERAVDLVRFIREEFDDYFGIAVAGFPEGYPQATLSMDEQIRFLKEKVEAGADFVLTQFFYNPSVFLNYVDKCREMGISCPIIPGTASLWYLNTLTKHFLDRRNDAHPKLFVLSTNDIFLQNFRASVRV